MLMFALFFAGFITEITSNVATANILLPVLGQCTTEVLVLVLPITFLKVTNFDFKL